MGRRCCQSVQTQTSLLRLNISTTPDVDMAESLFGLSSITPLLSSMADLSEKLRKWLYSGENNLSLTELDKRLLDPS